MTLYVGLENGNASYVLACPKCHRYDLSMAGVTIKPDDVIRVSYYCVGCHSPQILTVSAGYLSWNDEPIIRSVPSRARAKVE